MALPRCTIDGFTLAVPSDVAGAAQPTRLQIVTGPAFVEVDIDLARRALDDNACRGYDQLVQLGTTSRAAIGTSHIGRASHCLNIHTTVVRDKQPRATRSFTTTQKGTLPSRRPASSGGVRKRRLRPDRQRREQ